MIYFTAHTFKCVCHCIRSMFRVLGMYNFALPPNRRQLWQIFWALSPLKTADVFYGYSQIWISIDFVAWSVSDWKLVKSHRSITCPRWFHDFCLLFRCRVLFWSRRPPPGKRRICAWLEWRIPTKMNCSSSKSFHGKPWELRPSRPWAKTSLPCVS